MNICLVNLSVRPIAVIQPLRSELPLCAGDGRTAAAPKANYGMGGTLHGTRYMISATLNAPAESFDDPSEPFFEGLSMDDLLRPVHLNAKFFSMAPLPSFGAFDVMKNADFARDLARFDAHMRAAQNAFSGRLFQQNPPELPI